MRRFFWISGAILVVAFVLAQLQRPNFNLSPVAASASFDAQMHPDSQISNMLHQDCYNCHSEQGEIPWYGYVWPTSMLLQKDMRIGRARLDFSNWANLSPEMSSIRLRNACRMMQENKMPPWYYRPMHSGSTPRPEDVHAFCVWAQSQRPAQVTAQIQIPRR